MFSQFVRPAVLYLVVMTLLTGVIYPLFVTAVGQLVFSDQASGSLVYEDGRLVGSALVGQPFDDPKYFWGRPSATSPMPYNAAASSGSNLGPTEQKLAAALKSRAGALRQADPSNQSPPPVDLLTASGSGLDPHISPAAAEYQIGRVAKVRGISPDAVRDLVQQATEGRQLGFLGEPRVNVLRLNLQLDRMSSHKNVAIR
ncbi:MAG TPA: potassium-transporting ATPase subunit KdpC [Pirellulales bacterium]|jgi:K+-transporting ATPase ATPase C chain